MSKLVLEVAGHQLFAMLNWSLVLAPRLATTLASCVDLPRVPKNCRPRVNGWPAPARGASARLGSSVPYCRWCRSNDPKDSG